MAAHLVAQDERQLRHPAIAAGADHGVEIIHPDGVGLDQHLARSGRRRRQLDVVEHVGAAGAADLDGFHDSASGQRGARRGSAASISTHDADMRPPTFTEILRHGHAEHKRRAVADSDRIATLGHGAAQGHGFGRLRMLLRITFAWLMCDLAWLRDRFVVADPTVRRRHKPPRRQSLERRASPFGRRTRSCATLTIGRPAAADAAAAASRDSMPAPDLYGRQQAPGATGGLGVC